jgi:CheY-like chemotaxis protein/HPt (histidine-containing phosphotransfer) domain-containing protein
VVFDVDVTCGDGQLFAPAVRKEPDLAHVKLIRVVSLNTKDEAVESDETLVDGQITRPIKHRAVHRVIEAALGPLAGAPPVTEVRGKESVPADEANPFLSLRVLVAEDSAVNQKVVQFQLRKLGCQVDAVTDGEQAVIAIAEKSYDVVLMDCQMPKLDGWSTTRRIRELEKGGAHRSWIIAMTAHSLAGDREKCMEAGMDDYLSKPVRYRDLSAALQRCPEFGHASALHGAPIPANVVCQQRISGFRQLEEETGQKVLGSVIDLFIERTPPIFVEARQAMFRNDAPRIARLAHSIKGSCSNFGAHRMHAACERLEKVAEDGSLHFAEAVLDEVEREFGFVRVALESELGVKSA